MECPLRQYVMVNEAIGMHHEATCNGERGKWNAPQGNM